MADPVLLWNERDRCFAGRDRLSAAAPSVGLGLATAALDSCPTTGTTPLTERDRALLKRLATVNLGLGEVVLRMLAREHNGELDQEDLRAVGEPPHQLGADMIIRANEIDHPQIEST
jgi:hypothetical protein